VTDHLLGDVHAAVGDAFEFVVHLHHRQHRADAVLAPLPEAKQRDRRALDLDIDLVHEVIVGHHGRRLGLVMVEVRLDGTRQEIEDPAALRH